MKSIFKVLLIVMMSLCLFACSNTTEQEEEAKADMINPMVVYDSLDEINKKVGVKLVASRVANLESESYQIINDEIAEYDFTANDCRFIFRGAKKKEDISGIYIDAKPAYGNAELGLAEDDSFKAYRFFVEENQYVLSVKDDGTLSDDEFKAIYQDIEKGVMEAESCPEANALVGFYQDSYSQRATAEVEPSGRDMLSITITWPNSAEECEEWIVVAKYSGNKLRYDSLAHKRIVTDAEGNSSVSTNIIEEGGFFVAKDGCMYWTGSNDEVTSKCVFEKIDIEVQQ
ncbi:MAG: hypothetical protein KBT35_07820 [Firmicutes bacterium]|nr:hypothetical protein [Candidatus Colivicinus equi]